MQLQREHLGPRAEGSLPSLRLSRRPPWNGPIANRVATAERIRAVPAILHQASGQAYDHRSHQWLSLSARLGDRCVSSIGRYRRPPAAPGRLALRAPGRYVRGLRASRVVTTFLTKSRHGRAETHPLGRMQYLWVDLKGDIAILLVCVPRLPGLISCLHLGVRE